MFLLENEMPHQMFYSYDTHQIWAGTTFENNFKNPNMVFMQAIKP
jgi:hypothetical protein